MKTDGSSMTICQERKTYRRSAAVRSCVNKRDQREGEGDEQDHCYRPAMWTYFEGSHFHLKVMGLGFSTIKVLVGPKYYHLFFLKNWPLFRVTKATAIGLRWRKNKCIWRMECREHLEGFLDCQSRRAGAKVGVGPLIWARQPSQLKE